MLAIRNSLHSILFILFSNFILLLKSNTILVFVKHKFGYYEAGKAGDGDINSQPVLFAPHSYKIK